ncbi:MAG: methionine adenosyltransferase [Nanoarchaeota archaeon]|nr:methionine adenosyltransferase [Nanoarchaeota archaeon]
MAGEIILKKISLDRDYEIVELKGSGHPDTLSDRLAEELSVAYSNYTLNKFGVILHHNFDKLGILGGSSYVKFGEGRLTSPLRVLINGRVSTKFGSKKIPYLKIIDKVVRRYFLEKFPMINPKKDIKIHHNISTSSSPGKTDIEAKMEGTRKYWFEPRGKYDLKELIFLGSNDTSIGVGFAPLTNFEKSILDLEDSFNKKAFRKNKPWLGTDIKIMASKINKKIDITICIPQIANHVKTEEEYKQNLTKMRNYIVSFLVKIFPNHSIKIFINTRDDFDTGELYLTAIGSSIEGGDEGLVGRGNRINGLISQTKPYTMEGAAGKNPVYHVGKIYNIIAEEIAKSISKISNSYVEVYLISQSGRLLTDPWKTIIGIEKQTNSKEKKKIIAQINKNLREIPKITKKILKNKFRMV